MPKKRQNRQLHFPKLELYLKRHIELDGEEHGPMAQNLLEELCQSGENWKMAEDAAISSLQPRTDLGNYALNASSVLELQKDGLTF